MRVVFLHGPPAAGKHTVGVQLSELTGLPLFHNHLTVDLVKSLFEFGSEGFVRLRAQLWLASFAEAARAGRSFIFTFNPEATVAPALIDELVAVVQRAGGKVHFVELRCSRELVLQRIGNASRAQFGKLTDAGLYAQIEANGDVRGIELDEHPFFVATLFQPERAALRGVAPPIVAAFITAGAT